MPYKFILIDVDISSFYFEDFQKKFRKTFGDCPEVNDCEYEAWLESDATDYVENLEEIVSDLEEAIEKRDKSLVPTEIE